MSAIVFVGPTLSREEVTALIDAECRPPAAQGDVYRATLERPFCIGIIDGYFDGVPSVWHKEILWAMAEGIPVFGSASMGALRAAELCAFGMRGVGRIFEDYRDGLLEDDDEVAVLHAPAELGFRPLSEAMVTIRATLVKAAGAGVLSAERQAAIVDVAKALHYRERTWERILETAGSGDGASDAQALWAWLPDGRVDAKREDAIAMLKAMASEMAAPGPAPAADYSFESTHVWNGLTERVEAEAIMAERGAQLVLDELRLDQGRFKALRNRAALRRLALDEARSRNVTVGRSELLDEISRHRTRHGLMRRRDLATWLEQNEITERQYEILTRDSRLARAGAELSPEALSRHVIAELKWSGEFAALNRRALDKEAVLAGAPDPEPAGRATARQLNLVVWYFEQRLGETVPEDLDDHAQSLGFGSRQDLYRVLEREYLYCLMRQDDADGDEPELE